ncbi:MAG: cytidine deaminase [Dermatophilus congolensis]|nr:cytidine deaminase [Dermatophilus congolensis]
MSTKPPTVTPPDDAGLLELAREAARNAYAPYSDFQVGAALLLSDGTVVTGCNVENASYGLAICAERTAATRMVVQGGDRRIVKAAVIGLKAKPCFPCGACRQVLNEFACEQVIVEGENGPETYPFEQILPHSFGPSDLEN